VAGIGTINVMTWEGRGSPVVLLSTVQTMDLMVLLKTGDQAVPAEVALEVPVVVLPVCRERKLAA